MFSETQFSPAGPTGDVAWWGLAWFLSHRGEVQCYAGVHGARSGKADPCFHPGLLVQLEELGCTEPGFA